MRNLSARVLIVGGGPAGLAAAEELIRLGLKNIIVIDREAELGGIPRHCFHTGFGWFDMRRILSGPAYARRRVSVLEKTDSLTLLPETTALAWESSTALRTTGPAGPAIITADAVLLATGCRERPRSARLIPGSRPQGIITTGALQQIVYLKKQRAGERAVISGAEHVSFSAHHTLTSSGTRVCALVTDLPKHQTYLPFYFATAGWHRTPICVGSQITNIFGRKRVEGVEVTSQSTGARSQIECDCLVFSGDWIPDHELARLGKLAIDPKTKGPEVDSALRSSVSGVFAAGNLLHGAEMADVAALEGRFAARGLAKYLQGDAAEAPSLHVSVNDPLVWITPQRIDGAAPANGRFVLRTGRFVNKARIVVSQQSRILFTQNCRGLVPNRSICLSSSWLPKIKWENGDLQVSLEV